MTQHTDNGEIHMKLISSLKRVKDLENRNSLDPKRAQEISEGIRENKYHADEPITIAKIDGEDVIVDGFTRLKALLLAKKAYAPCIYIQAKTINEAIAHADRRFELRRDRDKYAILHRLTNSTLNNHGGVRQSKPSDDGLSAITLADLAKNMHVSESTVERVKARYYDRLTPEQRTNIENDSEAVYEIIPQIDAEITKQTAEITTAGGDPLASDSDKKKRVMRPKDAGETTLFRHLNLTVAEIEELRSHAKYWKVTSNTVCTLFLRATLSSPKKDQNLILENYTHHSSTQTVVAVSHDSSLQKNAAARSGSATGLNKKKTNRSTSEVIRKPGHAWSNEEETLLNIRVIQHARLKSQEEIIVEFQRDYRELGVKPRRRSAVLHKIHRTIPLRERLKKEPDLHKIEQEVLTVLRKNPPTTK